MQYEAVVRMVLGDQIATKPQKTVRTTDKTETDDDITLINDRMQEASQYSKEVCFPGKDDTFCVACATSAVTKSQLLHNEF